MQEVFDGEGGEGAEGCAVSGYEVVEGDVVEVCAGLEADTFDGCR